MGHTISKRSIVLILIVVLGAVCSLLLLSHRHNEDSYKRYILPTKLALDVSRVNIQKYKELTGNYPEVSEGKIIFDVKPDSFQFDTLPVKEYISSREGNDGIYSEINGKGGWFYDKTTGKICLNLSKPTNKYFKFYWGENSDDIPSEW